MIIPKHYNEYNSRNVIILVNILAFFTLKMTRNVVLLPTGKWLHSLVF